MRAETRRLFVQRKQHSFHACQTYRMTLLLAGLAFLLTFGTCLAQNTHSFQINPLMPTVQENTQDVHLFNGTYSIQACDVLNILENPTSNQLNVTSQPGLSDNIRTFDVILIQPIDYEKIQMLTVNLSASLKCNNIPAEQQIGTVLVMIIDEKDTPPMFVNNTYTVSIKENQQPGTEIVTGIEANEEDLWDTFTYTVNFKSYQVTMFENRTRPNNPEVIDIYLKSALDFELQQRHDFTITATDTVNLSSTCNVIINVINVQDTPPIFTAPHYHGRISEQAPLGTTILFVSAYDGDTASPHFQTEGTAPNEIFYFIHEGGAGMFSINDTSGVIITHAHLDIDNNPNVSNGLVVMTIMAEELNSSGEPQYGSTTASVQVLIQIEDANDNRPQFNAPFYTGNIREDALLNEPVTIEGGGYIAISDIDQAPSNNQFSIHIEKDGQPWDIFKPNIKSQYAYASLLIQLNKEYGLLGLGNTHITFQIVAQEMGNQSQSFPSVQADMTVWVRAKSTTAPPPEPVIDLPLSTSDIIIFVVGFLLLFNVGLTVFICCVMHRGRETVLGVFNRNSKYYISDRNKTGREENRTSNRATSNDGETSSEAERVGNSATGQTQAKRNAELSTKENFETFPSYPTLIIDSDKNEANMTSSLSPGQAKKKDSQARPETALLNILNKEDNQDITELKEGLKTGSLLDTSVYTEKKLAASQDPKDIITKEQTSSSLGQGFSNLMHKVQQKLVPGNKFDNSDPLQEEAGKLYTNVSPGHSNKSSFSDKTIGDVVPLIKSAPTSSKSDKTELQPTEEYQTSDSKAHNLTLLPSAKTDYSLQNAANKSSSTNKEVPSTSSSSKPKGESLVPYYAGDTQFTQTGVPPVALALPSNTGTSSLEHHITVTNPVYEPSSKASTESKDSPSSTRLTKSTSGKAFEAADLPTDTKASPVKTVQKLSSNPVPVEKMLTPLAPYSVPTNESPNSSLPFDIIQEIKHLHGGIDKDNTSKSQDYMMAAKNLLSATQRQQQSKGMTGEGPNLNPSQSVSSQGNKQEGKNELASNGKLTRF